MDFTRRIAVTAVLAGTLAAPAVCTAPAQAARAQAAPVRTASAAGPGRPAPRAASAAGPGRPAPRAADRGDPALDVVAVSVTALASAGGLLIARRRPR